MTGYASGTQFTYTVRARDAAGNPGPASNSVTATTKPAGPGDTITIVAAGDIALLTNTVMKLTLSGRSYSWEVIDTANYWGVTFTADDRTFYATLGTAGRTYLVRGDAVDTSAKVLRENAECPSLSPDGTRVAFKKRVPGDGARPWRQHVLDLRTMVETPLAEARGIDDQVVWLDNDTIAYGLPGEGIWAVPSNGEGTPRQLVPHASSPSVVL